MKSTLSLLGLILSHIPSYSLWGVKNNYSTLDIALSLLGTDSGPSLTHFITFPLGWRTIRCWISRCLFWDWFRAISTATLSHHITFPWKWRTATKYWILLGLLFWRPGSGSPGLMQSLWDEQLLLCFFGVNRALIMEHFIQFLPPLSQSHTHKHVQPTDTN